MGEAIRRDDQMEMVKEKRGTNGKEGATYFINDEWFGE